VGIPVCVLLIGLLSYLSGGITGMLMFGRWKGYSTFGLWNLTTLLGLHFAGRRAKGEVGKNVRRGRGKVRRVSFEFVFSLVFLLMTILAGLWLRFPLLD
jgi:hypothetical protein